MNIYQRINSVMKEVAYVQKDKAVTGMGAGYKAVTHDQLVSVARAALVKAGIAVVVTQSSGVLHEKGEKWNKDANQMVPDNMRLYSGMYDVSLVNIDEPSDKVTVSVEAHAMDNGDKAPGKAMTYATKTAILKLLWLETGENDESREEVKEKSKPRLEPERFKLGLQKIKDKELTKEEMLSRYFLTPSQKRELENV